MHQSIDPMAEESLGTRSRLGPEHLGAPGASGSMFDEAQSPSDSTPAGDDLIRRARQLYDENPALVIAGATAVAALGVLLWRAQSRPQSTSARLKREVDDFLRRDVSNFVETQKKNGADLAQMMTSMVTGAMAMQPGTLSAFRELAGAWLQAAGKKAEDLGRSVGSR